MQKTFDELALENEEEQQQRTDDDHRASSDQGPLRADFTQLCEHGETNRKWSARLAVRHDEGPQKIVPVKTNG